MEITFRSRIQKMREGKCLGRSISILVDGREAGFTGLMATDQEGTVLLSYDKSPFDIHVYKTVRAGLGTRLLHRAIEEATEAGFDTLVIDRATMGAKPFYDKTLARLADQGVIASHRVDKMPDEIGFHSYRYTVGLKGAEEQGL
jgi:hypothetical protein